MHSRSKEQREAVRQLIYLVLTRDMATFNPDRFKHWIKETDSKFRKVGLMLKFEIKDRLRADLDYQVNLKNEMLLGEILRLLEKREKDAPKGYEDEE